jgi:ribonuclease P protein component
MPRDARVEGFSRRHRFAERGAFGPVLRSPRKIRGRYAVLHLAQRRTEASRLGIALTRRLVPSALHRNRIKRQVREAFRRHALKRAGLDCVVTLRERFDPKTAPELIAEIRALFDQATRPANASR